MKSKVLSFICIIAIVCVSVLPINAVTPRVGEEIGNILNTDIKTYINGQRIPSYNINNKSAVFIKDLANYGFDTVFSQQSRTTTISYNQNKKLTPLKDFDETTGKVGTVAFRYVYTDINGIINGRRVECFNVKGYNAIYFSELGDFGTFTWDNSTRESKLTLTEKTVAPPTSTPAEPKEPPTQIIITPSTPTPVEPKEPPTQIIITPSTPKEPETPTQPNIQFDKSSFKSTDRFAISGNIHNIFEVESFKITNIEAKSSYYVMSYEIIGKLTFCQDAWGKTDKAKLFFDIYFYDKDGFVIGSRIMGSGSQMEVGEKFQRRDTFHAPLDTVRIEVKATHSTQTIE